MRNVIFLMMLVLASCQDHPKVIKDNKPDGVVTEFYPNGKPMMITTYSNGLKNGYNAYYDSSGVCIYQDYYYYDLIVGPITYFYANGQPKRYFFSNLENQNLLHIDYAQWNGVKDIYSRCINYTVNDIREDSAKKLALLLYLVKPPKLSFEYSILKNKKGADTGFVEIMKPEYDVPFVQIMLPLLPNTEQYSIGLNIYDSILNRRTVIYKDL